MFKKFSVVLLSCIMLLGVASFAGAQGKHFEGITIVFFPGGSEGGPFASVVYRGAKAAEEDRRARAGEHHDHARRRERPATSSVAMH